MNRQTFVIVGLGLLGGSLGGALRKIYPTTKVIGLSRSRKKIRLAQRKKLITSGTTQLSQAVRSADFIFICTPVDTISQFILEIDRYAKRGTIVTDVGSTKKELIDWVSCRKFKNIRFVGSHPMAGSHETGISHANPNLFRSSYTFVTVHAGINQKALRATVAIWRKLCHRVVLVTAQNHDSIVAEISHLPHLIAALLVSVVSTKKMGFASTGFKDTTRIAQGDPRLWVPVILSNRHNLSRLLGQFRRSLFNLEKSLKTPDKTFLKSLLEKSAGRRQKVTAK